MGIFSVSVECACRVGNHSVKYGFVPIKNLFNIEHIQNSIFANEAVTENMTLKDSGRDRLNDQ